MQCPVLKNNPVIIVAYNIIPEKQHKQTGWSEKVVVFQLEYLHLYVYVYVFMYIYRIYIYMNI